LAWRAACLMGLVAVASAIPTMNLPNESPAKAVHRIEDTLHGEFVAWKAKFAKAYEGAEHAAKFAVFQANVELIKAHNKLYETGEETFHMAVNQFADLTSTEFAKMVNGYRADLRNNNLKTGANNTVGLKCTHRNITVVPESVDWRTKGAVTEVKNQGQCGSCWAFSTTGAIEGAWKVSGNPLLSVSEEELVQCDKGKDQGCNGGIMENAYDWVIKNGGITSEDLYPYTSGTGIDGLCQKKKVLVKKAHISDYCDLNHDDEKDLEKALVQQPVAVAIEADQTSFQFYHGGILSAMKCGVKLDHGVLAVGYGVDPTTKMKYWIVKNSWGGMWGDKGYIMMEKEPKKGKGKKPPHSACGIAKAASYPVI
jgi:KDEL-tailed cysteine endopeptidase